MKLEDLILTELENMNLHGANIIELTCEAESTKISFEINNMEINFVATSETDFEVIALRRGEQVYTDEATLANCSGWVEYLLTVVYPVIEKHRA